MTNQEDKNSQWKRMSFNGNKVWAQIDDKKDFVKTDGKVLVKYNLKQDYEYKVKYENLKPEDQAVPSKNAKGAKRTKGTNGTKKTKKRVTEKSGSKNSSNSLAKQLSLEADLPDNCIKIYTDGASSGNPGPSGIGVLLMYGEKKKEISQYIGTATNNIAELTAIKVALEQLKRKDMPVCIFSDSSYSIGLLTKGWKSKKNIELSVQIRRLMGEFKELSFIKVKGHAGIKENEVADFLATSAIKKGSV